MRYVAASLIVWVLAGASVSRADDLRLAAVFSDHMVLQRDKPAPVWGWADPGEGLTIRFAGQQKTTRADATGQWRTALDPLDASAEARTLVVTSDNAKRELKIENVVVGDVWLCSGQSNMAFRMKRVENAQAEIATASHPNVRFFTVGEHFAQQPAQDVQGTWKPVTPDTAVDCSAVAYYFAVSLQKSQDVPIGLLVSAVGGTRIETWMQPDTLLSLGTSTKLLDRWRDVSAEEFVQILAAYRAFQHERDVVHPQAVRAAKAEGKPVPPEPARPALRCHDCPGALHNGMIAPLQPMALRGVLWYQGESNSGQAPAYTKLQPAMIADWRKVWGEQLPFLFVQLPPFQGTHPAFREAQLQIWQRTPNSAMVVTADVGDAKDVHPTRKQPVGERLALAARALSYGESVEFAGPVFKSVSISGSRAVVSFEHVGQGLRVRGDTLRGFTIAGKDGRFVDAQAQIEGSTVVVSSPQVSDPVAVRYGWAFVPDSNLFNDAGLPATPFRSDAPEQP
jgi:sialate O-acetylesterase